MDYGTFKIWVRRTGLDMKQFASLLGMNHGSISNYSTRGEVPRHMALLAVMMVELDQRNVDINSLIAKIDGHEMHNDMMRSGGGKGRKTGRKE